MSHRRMASSSVYSNPPCAACKFLRRKCLPGCIFAPYFPPDEPTKFVNVHKIFGASNVSKLLNEIPPHQREDAVNSLAYEAEARLKDPVYGCVGAISVLQRQVFNLQKELDATNANIMRYVSSNEIPYSTMDGVVHTQQRNNENEIGRRVDDESGFNFDQNSGISVPYSCSWSTGFAEERPENDEDGSS